MRSSHAVFFWFEYARVPGWTALCPLPRSILPVLIPNRLPVQLGKSVLDKVLDEMPDPAHCHDWLWWRKYFTVHCISWLVRVTSSLHLRSWACTWSQWTRRTVGWSVIYHLESSAYLQSKTFRLLSIPVSRLAPEQLVCPIDNPQWWLPAVCQIQESLSCVDPGSLDSQ